MIRYRIKTSYKERENARNIIKRTVAVGGTVDSGIYAKTYATSNTNKLYRNKLELFRRQIHFSYLYLYIKKYIFYIREKFNHK